MEYTQCSETADGGESPRRKHTTVRTGRKFEIKFWSLISLIKIRTQDKGLDSWNEHFCRIVESDQQNASRSQWILLMYSNFTPTCFGKWLPSSGCRRCHDNWPYWTDHNPYTPTTDTAWVASKASCIKYLVCLHTLAHVLACRDLFESGRLSLCNGRQWNVY
jgi:hypothetical protein